MILERLDGPAKVEWEASTNAAGNGARRAEGVVMDSGVVGPMRSTLARKTSTFCPVGGGSPVITRNRFCRKYSQISAGPL